MAKLPVSSSRLTDTICKQTCPAAAASFAAANAASDHPSQQNMFGATWRVRQQD